MEALVATFADLAGDGSVIARANAVSAAVAAASDEIERSRRLPPALLDKLHEAELFRLLLPRSSNGIETECVNSGYELLSPMAVNPLIGRYGNPRL